MKSFFVVNPSAGQGRLKSAWPQLLSTLSAKLGKPEHQFTQKPGDAVLITRRAIKKGFDLIVSVGGDGTLNECVNGFFRGEKRVENPPLLGVLPFGRGSDFARCLGIPLKPEKALERLKGRGSRPVDVGRIVCRTKSGDKVLRYFINIADVGLVANVVNESRGSPRLFGSKAAYLYGTFMSLVGFRSQWVKFSAARRKPPVGAKQVFNIVVASGRTFGSGMRVAPRANPSDGLFDILLVEKMSPLRLLMNVPKLYRRDPAALAGLESFRTDRLTVVPHGGGDPLLVEADGDTIGQIPATFEIIPRAIRFKV